MAWTQSDVDSISEAIASGVMSVRYANGRQVQYQSLDQLLAAKTVMQAELSLQSSMTSGIVRRKVAAFRNGC